MIHISVEPRDAYKKEEVEDEKKDTSEFERATNQEEEKLAPPS